MIRLLSLFIIGLIPFNYAFADVNLQTANLSIVGNTITFDVQISSTSGTFTLGSSYQSRNQPETIISLYVPYGYNESLNSPGEMAFTGITWIPAISSNYVETAPFGDLENGDGYMDLHLKGNNGGSLFTVTTTFQTIASITITLANKTSIANTGTIEFDPSLTFIKDATNNSDITKNNLDASATSNQTLPVSLSRFTASYNPSQRAAILLWTTATEENNDGFEIQRSIDGQNFEVIGFVAGAGNSVNDLEYTYTDNNIAQLATTTIYYRLKQVDFNGVYSFSPTKVIDLLKSTATFKWYPNPANNHVVIENGHSAYTQIFDFTGRKLLEMENAGNPVLDITGLEKGSYIIRFLDSSGNLLSQDCLIKN